MVAPKDAVASAPGPGFDPENKNTPLQGHVAFFDRDGDGVIWPYDTYGAPPSELSYPPLLIRRFRRYRGFRDLRFSIILSLLAVFIIHTGLSLVCSRV